jgi:hypothetical protein
MEFKLTRITAHLLTAGSYVVDLSCSFHSSDGAVSPHHGTMSITLNKDQVEGLTLAEIEENAGTAARRLLA